MFGVSKSGSSSSSSFVARIGGISDDDEGISLRTGDGGCQPSGIMDLISPSAEYSTEL
jgi:hypothetical protein